MRASHDGGLVRLEAQYADDDGGGFEVWIDDSEGWMLGPNGERLLATEFGFVHGTMPHHRSAVFL